MFTHDIIFKGRECGEEKGREREGERGRGARGREEQSHKLPEREKDSGAPVVRAPSSSGPGVQVPVSLSLETGRLVRVPPLGTGGGWDLGTGVGWALAQDAHRAWLGCRQSRGRGVWGLWEGEAPAKTPQCLAQHAHLQLEAPPVPLSAAKAGRAQVTQEEPRGDCHH